jgi:hypothetical protein
MLCRSLITFKNIITDIKMLHSHYTASDHCILLIYVNENAVIIYV